MSPRRHPGNAPSAFGHGNSAINSPLLASVPGPLDPALNLHRGDNSSGSPSCFYLIKWIDLLSLRFNHHHLRVDLCKLSRIWILLALNLPHHGLSFLNSLPHLRCDFTLTSATPHSPGAPHHPSARHPHHLSSIGSAPSPHHRRPSAHPPSTSPAQPPPPATPPGARTLGRRCGGSLV